MTKLISTLLLLASILTITLNSAFADDRSCRAYVGGAVQRYLENATGGTFSSENILAIKQSYSGPDRDGDWMEIYEVTLSFNDQPKKYIATLNGYCALLSLTPSSTKSVSPNKIREMAYCETYEPDCDRDNDDDGVPDNSDEI